MPELNPKDFAERLNDEGRSYVAGESRRLKAKYGDRVQQVVRRTAKQYKQGMRNAWQNSAQMQRWAGNAGVEAEQAYRSPSAAAKRAAVKKKVDEALRKASGK